MKLASVHVREYKCIRDSNPFDVGDVACLVGKNESGKTALLEAIYRLNPVVPEHGKFDVTDDYPRSTVEDYQQAVEKKQRHHATVACAKFSLQPDDLAEITEELGEGLFDDGEPSLELSKGYENELRFRVNLSEPAFVRNLVAKANLPTDIAEKAAAQPTVTGLQEFLAARSEEQARAFNDAQAKANAIEDPAEKARALDDAKTLAESESAKQLRSAVASVTQQGLQAYVFKRYLKDRAPKFLYFDEYYQMVGQVNVQKLMERQRSNQLLDSDRPMLGLVELARIDLSQLLQAGRTEALLNKLEGASNHLTRQILQYWSQNKHIGVRFDARHALAQDPEGMREGTNLWGRVYDSIHHVTTPLGQRSRGFVWFFSFLAWFSQQRKRLEPLVLLLDEPGLHLHGNAQGDLLRFIEVELKPFHQVIYTTHSPFMVDPSHFDRVRIVEDRSMLATAPLPPEEEGTKVFSEVLDATEGTLFPLQGALGFEIAQTLFIGPNSLIVEGASDLLYLQAISAILQEAGREGLRKEWTITPVGGSDKVPTFAALLGAQKGLNVAALIDVRKKDAQKIDQLYQRKILQKTHVHTFAMYTGAPEADIEDMFDVDLYLALVNGEFEKESATAVAEGDLPPGPDRRILARLEQHFQACPLKSGAQFNHYRPARYFVENSAALRGRLSAATLDRFEAACKALNALL